MRSQLFIGSLAVGLVVAGIAAILGGCGGDSDTGTGGGATAAGTGGASVSSTHSSTASSGPTTGTGGMMGDGNDTPDKASEIDLMNPVDAELTPTGDVDYYKFSGLKGQVIYLDIDAEDTDSVSFDPTYIDTVITLFDSNQKQIAEDGIPVPNGSWDARLFTILPADGDYYVRVEECWTWSKDPTNQCAGRADKTSTIYTLYNFVLDAATEGQVQEGAEPNDDAAAATPLEYAVYQGGGYYFTDSWGHFDTATDVDAFKFTVPLDDQPMLDGRETARFYALPGLTTGDGSATNVGKMWVVDPADPTKHLAEIDASKGTFLWPVLQFGKEYDFFIQHPGGASDPNDFYFFRHTGSGSNPIEKDNPPNDTPAAAEAVEVVDNGNDSYSHFVDGDIVAAPTDIDHYTVDATLVPAGGTISVACAGWAYGSGLRGLKASILNSDGTPLADPKATATEVEDDNIFIDSIAIPAGATSLIIKVEAASQDPNVSGTYYRCGFHLNPP